MSLRPMGGQKAQNTIPSLHPVGGRYPCRERSRLITKASVLSKTPWALMRGLTGTGKKELSLVPAHNATGAPGPGVGEKRRSL